MSTVAQQIDRVKALLLDTDTDAWNRSEVLTQHQDEIARIGREQRMGDILQIQGVSQQSLYTLPDSTLSVAQVLYNGLRLDYATEHFLDMLDVLWEFDKPIEPRYWTTNNQNPETLRVVPAPTRTGSITPIFPPTPFIMTYVDNLTVFLYRDFSDEANDEQDALPLLDVWEDVLVWRVAGELARREGPYQNLPTSQTCLAMAELLAGLIES